MNFLHRFLLLLGCSLPVMQAAMALEYPAGEPVKRFGMEIAAVYLQPVDMAPKGIMRAARQSDIHLEADIRALAHNPNGFSEGDWIPYLGIHYELLNTATRTRVSGDLMPMVANDGPHYGDNVKLTGPGRYHLKYTIYPPLARENPDGHRFGYHTDRLTGVRPWFKVFTVEFDFVYAGVGKRGGY